jgi:hypothetical protein
MTSLSRVHILVALAISLPACGSRTGLAPFERDATAPDAPADASLRDAPAPPEVWRRVPFSIQPGHLLDVDMRDNGDFVVVWAVDALDLGAQESEVRAQLFDANAQAIADPLLVYRSGDFGLTAVASFVDEGGFVVAFPVATGSPSNFHYGVRVRRYDERGEPVPDAEVLYNDEWRPSIAPLAGGGFVVGSQIWDNLVSSRPLVVRTFASTGLLTTGAPLSLSESCGRIVPSPDGGFTVVCYEPAIVAHRYDATGRETGPSIELAPHPDAGGITALEYLPDASLVIASDSHVRTLAADGSPSGEWIDVRGEPTPEPAYVRLAVGGCGARPCRLTGIWVERAVDDEQPMFRSLEASPRLELGVEEPPLAPSAGFGTERMAYSDADVAADSSGRVVMAWTTLYRMPDRSLQDGIEGLLITNAPAD